MTSNIYFAKPGSVWTVQISTFKKPNVTQSGNVGNELSWPSSFRLYYVSNIRTCLEFELTNLHILPIRMLIKMLMSSETVNFVTELRHWQRAVGKGLHTQHLLCLTHHKPARNVIDIVTYYWFVVRVLNTWQPRGNCLYFCLLAFISVWRIWWMVGFWMRMVVAANRVRLVTENLSSFRSISTCKH